MQSGGGRAPRDCSSADFDAVIEAARAGQPAAWDRLYRALAPAVAGYLRMQSAAEPDDLVSDVFLGVFRGIAAFTGGEAEFRSWVFVIAHRRLQDERRRRFRRPPGVAFGSGHGGSGAAPQAVSAEDEALRRSAADRVQSICAQLAPDQRDVVLLRILGEFTVDQVAEMLGKTPGAVKQLQRRGFEAIRRISTEGSSRRTSSPEGVPL